MKVRAILEFDLENEDGGPIEDRREYAWAAEAADSAIRARLMGSGFLNDTLISTYQVNVGVFDSTMDEIDAENMMNAHGGAWGEHPVYPVASWMHEVANSDTRSGYWPWVAARLESA